MVALVAGCGSGSSGGPGTQPSGVAVSTPAAHHHHHHTPAPPTPTSPPTAAPTATVTVTAPAAVSRCLSIHLTLSLGLGQGTAGSSYQNIVLTNTGSAACTLYGYPGVSFVDASGALIGKPSSEDAGTKKTVTLAAGGAAHALLRQPDAGNFPPSACHKTTADRLRVYPPGETNPLFVHDAQQVCSTSAGRTGIGVMLAGSGG
jgi:hypothetical protein